MTWVATGTATAAEIAAAAEAAAIAAETAAAVETAATTATALEAAPTATALEAAPGAITEALPGVTPPPGTLPAGIEQITATPPGAPVEPLPPAGSTPTPTPQPAGIQTASGPATSDVASYQSDQATIDLIKNYQPGPQPQLSPEVLQATGNAPLPSSAPQQAPITPQQASTLKSTDAYELDRLAAQQGVFPEGSYQLPTQTPTPAPTAQNGFMQGFSEFADKHPFLTGAGIYTVASATGMLNQKPQTFNQPKENYTGPTLSKDFKGGPYSEPNVYKPRYAAAGGIMMAGGGGPVERMSQNVTGGSSNMYPQSQQEHTNFATPTQMPASAEIIRSDYDTKTQPYTGVDTTNMASGGIARYYRGRLATSDSTGGRGDVYGATQRFLDMYDPSSRYTPPSDATNPDVGIFHDTNPSTRSKDALEAAQIRQNALKKRAYVNTGAKYVPASRGMGQLSFAAPGGKGDKEQDYDSVLAASGGIMQANLGSYAAGGNPRLLRGPGDGMSDNIPATIGGKQPARLADGEFVVPADVVSHLGNGSTEAGAKKLHQMMDKVRMDRTGRKKQAPAVKPGKYIPK